MKNSRESRAYNWEIIWLNGCQFKNPGQYQKFKLNIFQNFLNLAHSVRIFPRAFRRYFMNLRATFWMAESYKNSLLKLNLIKIQPEKFK